MEEDLACRLDLAQLCCGSPALCQFLLLVHHTGAMSNASPPTWCATSTTLQRVVGTLLKGHSAYTPRAPSGQSHLMLMRARAIGSLAAKETHLVPAGWA